MMNSWNHNTVRAGKWLAGTIGVFAVFAASAEMRLDYLLPLGEYTFLISGYIMLALCAILAFVTTYHAVAAMRCKLATKKDFSAGFLILLLSGAIFVISTVGLVNF